MAIGHVELAHRFDRPAIMPPRLRLPSQHLCGFLPVRENCSGVSLVLLPQARLFSRDSTVRPSRLLPSQRRRFADSSTDRPASGPNQDVLPHVSEEAATTSEIMGEDGPDIGQGTPVQEVRFSEGSQDFSAPAVLTAAIRLRSLLECCG